VIDAEAGHDLAGGVHDTHRVRGSGPVQTDEQLGFIQVERQLVPSRWQRQLGEEAKPPDGR
jgi:hypothetical protein